MQARKFGELATLHDDNITWLSFRVTFANTLVPSLYDPVGYFSLGIWVLCQLRDDAVTGLIIFPIHLRVVCKHGAITSKSHGKANLH